MSFSFVDLFAGVGGFHYGLSNVGGVCVYANEWEPHAAKLYGLNHGVKPDGDITKVDVGDIPEHDVLAAGFPCQAFSISGKRNGFSDPRGTLFFDIMRIVEARKPRVVFLENVKNFATHDGGKTLLTVRNSLTNAGYVFYSKLYNASDFGLPQSRKRFIMVGIREDVDDADGFVFPEPSKPLVALKSVLETNVSAEYYVNRSDVVLDLSKRSRNVVNKPVRVGMVNKGGQGERIYDINGHAITLSAYGGGVGAKTGLYYVDGKIRKLTPRECARLQGFPESFILPESKQTAWRVFGNAVPVPIVQTVAEALVEQSIIGSVTEV